MARPKLISEYKEKYYEVGRLTDRLRDLYEDLDRIFWYEFNEEERKRVRLELFNEDKRLFDEVMEKFGDS